MSEEDLISKIFLGLHNVFSSLYEAFLFIGDTGDVVMAIIDVLVTTWLFYYILKLVRDSRAWQLLKGVVLILFLGMLSKFTGLSTIAFILNNTISVFALAFVVLFQPELRRALETVGRSGFSVITPGEHQSNKNPYIKVIDALVAACDDMVRTNTGALIIIERNTPLGDFEKQDNAVQINADVSETLLNQIFYFGSPMHDGAALIRGNKVVAARIHVPLSDGFQVRKDRGTRHRAAMEASMIGDTIAVIVSEEHRKISIAVEGKLYTLKDAQALKLQLQHLLIPDAGLGHFSLFKTLKERKKKNSGAKRRQFKRRSALLLLSSFLMASSVWLYVQGTVNPLKQKSFAVPVVYRSAEVPELKGLKADLPIQRVSVTLTARQKLIDDLGSADVKAYIDLAEVRGPGIVDMPVHIEVNTDLHTRLDNVNPGTMSVAVRFIENAKNDKENDKESD